MAPQLRIPISASVDKFEDDMKKAGQVTRTVTRQIVQTFVQANKEILSSTSLTVAGMSSEWAKLQARSVASSLAFKLGWVAAGYAVLQGIRAMVDGAIERLGELVSISERAQKSGVSAQFFQSFVAGAQDAKVSVETLEKALQHAYEATKDVLNPDWSVWDVGKKKVTDVEKTMVEMRELFTTGQSFTGIDLFRGAENQDQRVKAVLVYITQLEAIGERLAALNLAEKMFGGDLAEQFRNGNKSAQGMLDTLERMGEAGSGVWANEIVKAAEEVNQKLKAAHDHLERELKPSWASLVEIVNTIKSAWAEVVELLAKGVSIMNSIDPKWAVRLIQLGVNPGGAIAGIVKDQFIGAPTTPQTLADQLGLNSPGINARPETVPLPARRPSGAPKAEKEKEAAELTDAFDTASAAIQRNIAALEADAAAVGLTNAQHTQLRGELRLLEAARQSDVDITQEQITQYAKLRQTMDATNALQAAGITLTDEQNQKFMQLSATLLMVQTNVDKTRRAFEGMNEAARFAGNQLVDVIDRATQKGAKFGDIMSDVLRTVSRELLRAAITGEGAFAKMLGLASSSSGGTGGIIGALLKGFGAGGGGATVADASFGGFAAAGTNAALVKMAEGGTIPPGGLAYVGEHGPNPRLIRAGAEPIMVTPNSLASGGSSSIIGGDTNITVQGNADASTVAMMQRMLAERDRRFVADVAHATNELRRRSVFTR